MKHLFVAALALALAACSTLPRFEAANDVHAFLVSIRDGDSRVFDDHVDKPALKTNLKARLITEASHSDRLGGMSALLAGPLVDLAVDTAARPEVFRAVAVQYGYAQDRPLPSTLALAALVRPLDGGRACLATRKDGPCTFIFKNEDGVWRLIDFQGHIHFEKGKLRLTE